MGFPPQLLNSSVVSAQNRWRNYWFGMLINGKYEQIIIPPMEDKGLVLKDILQTDHDEPPVPINERNADITRTLIKRHCVQLLQCTREQEIMA